MYKITFWICVLVYPKSWCKILILKLSGIQIMLLPKNSWPYQWTWHGQLLSLLLFLPEHGKNVLNRKLLSKTSPCFKTILNIANIFSILVQRNPFINNSFVNVSKEFYLFHICWKEECLQEKIIQNMYRNQRWNRFNVIFKHVTFMVS